MSSILIRILEFGGIPILMLILGWLVGRYLKPWLHSEKHPSRLEWARELAMIADRVTDELVRANPNARWDDILDRAVKVIIDKLDIPTSKTGKLRAARDEAQYQLQMKLNTA